jgi:polyphosphate kinase
MVKRPMKRRDYMRVLRPLHIELLKVQRWVAESGSRLAIIFEGRDAAGKGSAIKHVTKHLNPRSCRVVALSKPTPQELGQWYFQRYVAHLPAAGEITIFDRSWYNRAGLERVMGFCDEPQAEAFLCAAPAFEEMLVGSGLTLMKYYFSVSKEEQARRLQRRRTSPLKQWKVTPLDLQAQAKWDAYSAAECEMFKRSSSPWAPWVWVDANDKRQARLQVIRHLLASLDYPDKSKELLAADPNLVKQMPVSS